jgi:hypothetical protein
MLRLITLMLTVTLMLEGAREAGWSRRGVRRGGLLRGQHPYASPRRKGVPGFSPENPAAPSWQIKWKW